MALETGTYISDLVAANPAPGDLKSFGDDHIRLIKYTLKTTFPNITGAVTATQSDFSNLTGLTGNIQTQLNAKGAIAGQTWAGFHDYGSATLRAATKSAGDSSTQVATTAYADNAALFAVSSYAPLASPALTGTPTAPTATVGTTTTQIATTAYVANYVVAAGGVPAQPGGTPTYVLQSIAGNVSWAVRPLGRIYFTAAN